MKEKKHPADFEIIGLFFDRDETAVGVTEAKYGAYLGTVAYNILADRRDSEECVNDALMSAWESIPPAKPDNFKAFLTSLVRRRAVDSYRKSHRLRNVPSVMTESLSELEFLVGSSSDTHAAFEAAHLALILNDFVKALNARRRYIFISRYYLAHKISDIANKLSLSRSSVNKELASIREDLRRTLEKEGYSV